MKQLIVFISVLFSVIAARAQETGEFELISSLDGGITQLFRAGDLTFVMIGTTFEILDTSDPLHPVRIGTYDFHQTIYQPFCKKLCFGESRFYILQNDSLRIVDIQNPEAPVLISNELFEYGIGVSRGLSCQGDLLAVSPNTEGMAVFDMSQPSDPEVIFSYDERVYMALFNENTLFVSRPDSLVTYDFSDINNIRHRHAIYSGGSWGVWERDEHRLYTRKSRYLGYPDFCYSMLLHEFDVSDPDTIVSVAGIYMDCEFDAPPFGYMGNGEYSFFSAPSGLRLYDLTLIESQLLDVVSRPFYDVKVNDSHAYASDGHLCIFDVNEEEQLVEVGRYESNVPTSIAFSDDLAIVANGNLLFLDCVDPGNPVTIGTMQTPGRARDVFVRDEMAYVADGESGLQIIDFSSPQAPVIVGSADLDGDFCAIALAGGHAYLASTDFGLQIFDISNPTAPELIGAYEATSPVHDVILIGDQVYMANDENGLLVVDVSNPQAPEFRCTISTLGSTLSLTRQGDYVLLADGPSGRIYFIDVTDPQEPSYRTYYDSDMSVVNHVSRQGDVTYLAAGVDGILALNTSEPHNCVHLGEYDTPGNVRSITVHDTLLYVADQIGGLEVLHFEHTLDVPASRLAQPKSIVLHQNHPNPFNPCTVIEYSLTSPLNLQFKVYDLQGRLVQSRRLGLQSAGQHQIQFDGQNLASGIYFYQLESEQTTERRKMLLVR